MDKKIINDNAMGKDIIKGGVFFGSNLTPSGAFSNTPKYHTEPVNEETEASLMLTLQKVKDSLKASLNEETGSENPDDDNIEKFLYDFTELLIDYRDLRNYVFYGSANTELAYNIKYIIENFPYKTLIGQKFGHSFIKFENYIEDSREYTDILFPERFYYNEDTFEQLILDNYNKFNFYDDSPDIKWSDYNVLDKNGRKYPIVNAVTPYKSPSVLKVTALENTTTLNPDSISYKTIRITTEVDHTYQVGQIIQFNELLCMDATKKLQFKVDVFDGVDIQTYYYDMNKTSFVITSVTNNTFTVRRRDAQLIYEDIEVEDYGLNPFYDSTEPGIVRIYPLSGNAHPFIIKLKVKGTFNKDSFSNFDFNQEPYKGFIISPKQDIINNFELNLTPIQKMLLSPQPINPTPWPRRDVTGNIQNIATGDDFEDDFYNWLRSSESMYNVAEGEERDEAYGTSLYHEFRLVSALALDESYSNQLIRRVVPYDFISELNDTEDYYFQRFILIAGWFFDQIRVYIKFIKYAHTINEGEFNQLSPQFYRYYSDYYGLDLFQDDGIDFSQLVIKTEPGVYFVDDIDELNNKYYRHTLKELQEERQKRLLLSLFYLYKIKGTHACINQLISLLGAPNGFLAFNEFAFAVDDRDNVGYPTNGYGGRRIKNNEKVHVPGVSFEIDPNHLVDKTNIDNPLNKPYVYRPLYNNDYVHNLREVSVHTDPNGAIDNQIMDIFGKQRYNYIKFNKGEFTNLQKTGDFHLLPLTVPDKFYGFSVDYMIPRNGIKKGLGNDTEEVTCNIFSLYYIKDAEQKPTIGIVNISISADFTTATIVTVNPHNFKKGDSVFISGTNGIVNINDLMFDVQAISNAYTFEIFGDFSGQYTGNGTVISGELNKITSTEDMKYTYPLAVNYKNRNFNTDTSFAVDSSLTPVVDGFTNPTSDFNILKNKYTNSVYTEDSYVITRVEGNDLVFRLRIKSEVDGTYGERCAMLENVFSADGLNHSLRMLIREEGVEVYKDYAYIGFAKWLNISHAGPYKAYEIPKSEIKALIYDSDNCMDYYEPLNTEDFVASVNKPNLGVDKVRWWDLFLGMPENIEFYFRKVNFFENTVVNDYNIGDRMTNTDALTAEFYSFEVANPDKGSIVQRSLGDFIIPAVFYEKKPNLVPDYYGYALPTSKDQYDREIVTDVNLRSRSLYDLNRDNLFLNKLQDFFNVGDIFRDNAWSNNIHKIYNYELFNGELNELYKLYSAQVLTYQSLAEFLELIEKKFKSVFKQFIPIVINIMQFGRIIKNGQFKQAKIRLIGSDKVCEGAYVSANSYISTYLFHKDGSTMDGIDEGEDFVFRLEIPSVNFTLIPNTVITWEYNKIYTINKIISAINNSTIANDGHVKADIYCDKLRIKINYDWFFAEYGYDANDLLLMVEQFPIQKIYQFDGGYLTAGDYVPQVVDNCGDIVSPAYYKGKVCGKVTYSLPTPPNEDVFIYYESEGQPAIYPVFEDELANDSIFIKNSNE